VAAATATTTTLTSTTTVQINIDSNGTKLHMLLLLLLLLLMLLLLMLLLLLLLLLHCSGKLRSFLQSGHSSFFKGNCFALFSSNVVAKFLFANKCIIEVGRFQGDPMSL
jgi:hypothetical protein